MQRFASPTNPAAAADLAFFFDKLEAGPFDIGPYEAPADTGNKAVCLCCWLLAAVKEAYPTVVVRGLQACVLPTAPSRPMMCLQCYEPGAPAAPLHCRRPRLGVQRWQPLEARQGQQRQGLRLLLEVACSRRDLLRVSVVALVVALEPGLEPGLGLAQEQGPVQGLVPGTG